MYFDWGPVVADRYGLSFSGLSAGECAAMGWTYETVGNSCYHLNWPTAWTAVSLGAGGSYNLGNMTGRTVSLSVIAGLPWGNWTGRWLTCRPPTVAPTGLARTCGAGGTSATITWNQVPGAVRYLPRLQGMTPAQCAANGLTLWTDNVTCYHNNWTSTSLTVAITPDTWHSFWVHAGDSVGDASVGLGFSCPSTAPPIPPPTAVTGSCSADGRTGTFSWTAPAGYTTFQTRVSTDGIGLLTNLVISGTDNNWVGTSKSFTTTPGRTYYYWVETKDPSRPGQNWSAYVGGSMTCPAALVPSVPTGLTASCSVTGSSGSVTFNWSPVTGATRYELTVGGTTFNTVSPSRVVNNLAVQSHSWSVRACNTAGCSAAASSIVTCAAPPPPAITLTATPSLIRSGDQARLTWSVTAPYPVRCILTGNGSSATFDYTTVGTSVNSPNPYLTTPISNSTNFTLTCSPNPAVAGVTSASASARVDVIPEQQEI
ncbi:hypothetical protein K2Q16_02600 [Patescibacteria group bacterium]|nr:hypothetical protein [Patescibacteria group bacterium]